MTVKLLTKQHIECLSLKEGCTGSSESTPVKMPNCWKSHIAGHYYQTVLTQMNFCHFEAYHLGLHHLPTYPFTVFKSQEVNVHENNSTSDIL